MSEPENKPAEPAPAQQELSHTPLIPEKGLRGRLLQAGEWLERPPGKHMGVWTTLIVVLIMLVLALIGSGT